MKLFSSHISIKEKALFYENLANLLEGWVSLLSALKGLRERTPAWSALADGIDNLLFFIEWGDSVNVAMRKLPNFFDEQEIAIVESGEQTGMIQKAFMAVSLDLRSQEELRGKITSAMTYPIIIFLFLCIAIAVVMIYVIPQLMPIIWDLWGNLPWTTRSLIATSDFMKGNYVFIFGFLVAIALVFQGYTKTDSGKIWWDRTKIGFPVTGMVYKNYLIVRVMSTFALLNSSGVSIVKTLRLTGSSSGNEVVKMLFNSISDDVSHGTKISESIKNRDPNAFFFTPDINQMIESAEKTSTIGEVVSKIAIQYKREVDSALATMVKFIEPMALLLAWIFVLWFAIAIFSAIMQIVASASVQ